MQIYSLLSELDRKVILFTYEQQRDKTAMPSGLMNEEYRAFIITEGEFILWELEKRKLVEAEIVSHAWLVTSKDNESLLFHFQERNRVTINGLFEGGQREGIWQLEHGILKVCFEYQSHSYDIDIIANNNRPIHSALQIVDEKNVELLKVAPISHAKYGKALLD
ncbi:MAG: hypothetical protein GY951_04435 [Psychromonas sp.]|nr:hypothetical protein [Alteromonadales bacterium]MCP5077286.1 hypothetical protein [Psychromonas sp.]